MPKPFNVLMPYAVTKARRSKLFRSNCTPWNEFVVASIPESLRQTSMIMVIEMAEALVACYKLGLDVLGSGRGAGGPVVVHVLLWATCGGKS